VPAANLIGRAEQILKQIASNAPVSVRLSLEAVNRGMATGLSLCTSFSSVWKHWKWLRGFGATRATLSGDNRGDGLRMQVA